jgi:hypothetical protein
MIERNLPGVGHKFDGNQIPSWMSSIADHQKEPSSIVTPNKPPKNRINQPRPLSSNQWKPNGSFQGKEVHFPSILSVHNKM